MFGLLNSSQIYGLQHEHEYTASKGASVSTFTNTPANNINPKNHNHKHQRCSSSVSDTLKESKFFATFSSMQQGIRSPTNFIEKFIKSELLSGYDTIKNYTNFQHTSSTSTHSHSHSNTPTNTTKKKQQQTTSGHSAHPDGILTSFNCLQGSYRSSSDGDFYEAVNVSTQRITTITNSVTTNTHQSTTITTTSPTPTFNKSAPDMTIKCSKNLLVVPPQIQAPATLQNYQKLPEDCEHDLPADVAAVAVVTVSSGASSGEFNSDTTTGHTTTNAGNSLYKKLSFGGRISRNLDAPSQAQSSEVPSDNSSSSISTTTTNSSGNNKTSSSTSNTSNKSNDLQRTSSASSTGDCVSAKERKKALLNASEYATPMQLTPERAQRRKLMQMISNYDQQNKLLQRELGKEKRRRTEELACVVKSLIHFESKLKTDMKTVNQRLLDKDAEICRLVRQNRALRKRVTLLQLVEQESARDEGVVEDDEAEAEAEAAAQVEISSCRDSKYDDDDDKHLMVDCLVLEALQCINCRKQFYDIELKESCTQTGAKDGGRNNDDHTTGHGSSSDDTTVSSSFYGARRSVRYTSKRTSGTFRDYMRSRAMNIDDPALDNNSEENTSTISRDDSQTSYEKLNIYSRTIERMHGVKCENQRERAREWEQSGLERSASRLSNKSCKSSKSSKSSGSRSSSDSSKAIKKSNTQIEEDDGIFSPTQDDDFEEETLLPLPSNSVGMCVRRAGVGEEHQPESAMKTAPRRSTEFSEASPKQVYETSTDDWYASASDQEEIGSTASKSYGKGAVNPVLECVNQILLQQSMEECSNSLEHSSGSETLQLTPKTPPSYLQVPPANLPRRSSLSGRRSSRSNSHSSEGQTSRNGTLTRKRVHFSTKNSMVHVPRNDDNDDDDENSTEAEQSTVKMISALQPHYYPMNYCPSSAQQQQLSADIATGTATDVEAEHTRLDTLNYESIYSNEYEPIGSEHNSSNLYVDMESANKLNSHASGGKMTKMPPALPPKPANLLKFKKSLQQLDEVPDEHLQQDCGASTTTAASEPDYCSISEVNVGMTSVQIVADVHKAPPTESDADLECPSIGVPALELVELEVSTVGSDDTCAASQKTDEIEEIFADIPKLPNVAAIIAPKASKYEQSGTGDYLIMSPKVETLQAARKLLPSSANCTPNKSNAANNGNKLVLSNTPAHTKNRSTKLESTPLKLQLHGNSQQYKRKHMPNILAEINKRMSQPNSPTTPTPNFATALTTTPTKLTPTAKTKSSMQTPNALLKQLESSTPNLPLQAEFDWYNLDAEYGRATASLNTVDSLNGSKMLEEIHEDHESVVTAADEYILDEEFSLACEKSEEQPEPASPNSMLERTNAKNASKSDAALIAAGCEAVNFPLFSENSPPVPPAMLGGNANTKKIKKNLANFEKFIEGSGLSTKPLPSKRKIYFAGPFV